METEGSGQESVDDVRNATEQVHAGASAVIEHLPTLAGKARYRSRQVVGRFPEAFDHLRIRAQGSVTRLQEMPDSELGLLTAVSIGLGTGLRLAGASRLATLAGLAPASILGFAIVSRPKRSRLAQHRARP